MDGQFFLTSGLSQKDSQQIMNLLHFFVFSLKFLFAFGESPSLLLSTAIRINKVIVFYPMDVISERDLNVCQQRSACNIIHKRFWLPPMVERLCRCPHRNECPWTWSDADNQTVYLNNRSQLKFCTGISDLSVCTQKKTAIAVLTLRSPPDGIKPSKNHTELQNGDRSRRHSEHRNITISCNCLEPHYWKLKSNATKSNQGTLVHQAYYCSKLKKCARSDFCGYVRLDTHSTFYRCSCPKGHMCITKNKTIYHADEILYNGSAYKAYCMPRRLRPQNS